MNVRRLFSLVLAVAFALLALGGCQAGPKGAASLKEKGMELTAAMAELAASGIYSADATTMEGASDLTEAMAGDFSAPIAVYAITLPEGTVGRLLSLDKSIPQSLADWLEGRACASIGSMLIARSGVQSLAALISVSYGKSFVFGGLEKPTLYLYKYAGALCVMVSFVPGEDGAVSGSAMFIPTDETLAAAASADDVRAWLLQAIELDADVSEIE